MNYLTYELIEKRMGTQMLTGLSDNDPDIVVMAATASEAFADIHLAKQYSTPIDLVSYPEAAPLLQMLTLDLTEYRLHSRRPPIPDDVRTRYDDADRVLRQLARNELVLPEIPSTGIQGKAMGLTRVLTSEELRAC